MRREDGLVLLFTPPFDTGAARSRLHQGLSARHPRERRPVHARRALVGDRLRDARRRRQGGRAVLAPESDQSRRARARASIATRSSPTSSPPTSTPSRRTSAAAAGPGTRARPAGCIAPGSKRCSASGCGRTRSSSIPASRGPGRASRSPSATARALRDRGRESARREPRRRAHRARRRERPMRSRRSSACATTARPIACGSCSADARRGPGSALADAALELRQRRLSMKALRATLPSVVQKPMRGSSTVPEIGIRVATRSCGWSSKSSDGGADDGLPERGEQPCSEIPPRDRSTSTSLKNGFT